MKLADEQLVLDTNILVHWLRGKTAAERLKADYALGERRPRPVVPVVVKGELKAFSLNLHWGDDKRERLDALLRELPTADISSEAVIAAYANLDAVSRSMGRKMGKNDLWIAAVAKVLDAVILSTDGDFDHLHPKHVRVEYVSAQALGL